MRPAGRTSSSQRHCGPECDLSPVSGTPIGRSAATADRIASALDLLVAAGELTAARPEAWELTQLEGGWSRHTYVLSPRSGAERRYVVRVKPPDAIVASDLVREYRTYAALADSAVPAPRVYGVEGDDDTPFGGPFFVQEWRPGQSPNVWRRRDREALEENWRTTRTLAVDVVTTLAEIHAVDPALLPFLGAPRVFEDVVSHWRDTYEEARMVRDPIVDEAFAWVAGRRPSEERLGLVHGDYRTGNMLLEGGRVAAVVDWELAYLGDTSFDLGYLSLDYFAGTFVARGSDLACAVADRDWLLAEYEQLTGRTLDREAVRTYAVVGALMLIAIFMIGIRTYAEGRTTDMRMAWNRFAVPCLRHELTELMDW